MTWEKVAGRGQQRLVINQGGRTGKKNAREERPGGSTGEKQERPGDGQQRRRHTEKMRRGWRQMGQAETEGRPWGPRPCGVGLGGTLVPDTGSWSGRSCPAPGPPPSAHPACPGCPAGTAGALLSSAPSHIRGCPRAGRTSAGPREWPRSTHHHEGLGSPPPVRLRQPR